MEVSQALISDLLRPKATQRRVRPVRGPRTRQAVRHTGERRTMLAVSASPQRSISSVRTRNARRSYARLSRQAATAHRPLPRATEPVAPLFHLPGSELLLRCVLGTHTWADVETGRGTQCRCSGCGAVKLAGKR